jgi:F0F1-type ATP synthase assembly protein I
MAGEQSSPKRPQSGADVGWAALGYLIAGIGAWGLIGWLIDGWLDVPMHLGLLVGMMIGLAGAVYLIVKRMGM